MGLLTSVRMALTRHLHGLLPHWDEAKAAPCNHVVQFYAGPFPAGDVANFISAGLAKGEAAVVIATPAHAKALRKRLDGQEGVTYLDAQETLDRFLVHGRPDRVRFFDTVGQVARAAAARGNGHVRAFGEMVVLLCEQGEPEAAAELEALWNELGARQGLSLLCSYPASSLSGRNRAHAGGLRDLHTHLTA